MLVLWTSLAGRVRLGAPVVSAPSSADPLIFDDLISVMARLGLYYGVRVVVVVGVPVPSRMMVSLCRKVWVRLRHGVVLLIWLTPARMTIGPALVLPVRVRQCLSCVVPKLLPYEAITNSALMPVVTSRGVWFFLACCRSRVSWLRWWIRMRAVGLISI